MSMAPQPKPQDETDPQVDMEATGSFALTGAFDERQCALCFENPRTRDRIYRHREVGRLWLVNFTRHPQARVLSIQELVRYAKDHAIGDDLLNKLFGAGFVAWVCKCRQRWGQATFDNEVFIEVARQLRMTYGEVDIEATKWGDVLFSDTSVDFDDLVVARRRAKTAVDMLMQAGFTAHTATRYIWPGPDGQP